MIKPKSLAPTPDRTLVGIQRSLAEFKAENYREIIQLLSQLPSQERTSLTFAQIGGVVVKISNSVSCRMLSWPDVACSIVAATAADLEEAMLRTEDYEIRVRLRTLLNLMRESAAEREPIDVRIINAGELKSDKAIRITRDEGTGKMTGAVVANMS
jgi:hypothetical protein